MQLECVVVSSICVAVCLGRGLGLLKVYSGWLQVVQPQIVSFREAGFFSQ